MAETMSSKAESVALLDNGVACYHASFSKCITRGDSVVYSDNQVKVEKLPWFTSRDNHGTHMADLITQMNPYCKLWAFRINTWQRDIKVERALEVCLALPLLPMRCRNPH
jgi:hypothetical protein